ncbi:armadillo repeat-containing protein 2-like [Ciona intestinalis]
MMEHRKAGMSMKKYKTIPNRDFIGSERPSSAEVIRDAKQWCALQAIQTRRPSTPRDASRSLFGASAEGTRGNSRPPSAFSIGPQHFDPTDSPSRPNSGAIAKSKLAPLNHKPIVPSNPELLVGKKSSMMVSSSQRTPGDGSELVLRKGAKQQTPRSPVKAVHADQKVNNFDEIDDKTPSMLIPSRYHPTPPPARPKTQKTAQKQKDIVIPTAPDEQRAPSSGSTASSAGSVGRSSGDRRRPSPGSGGGSGGQRNDESAEEAFYWNQTVLPLVEKLEEYSQASDPDQLCEVCGSLYTTLYDGSCFVRMSYRRRTSLLSALFRLLHIKSHDLHLLSARIILELRVTSKNLTSLCKLMFRICRDKQHDLLFMKYKLIVPMLNVFLDVSDPLPKYEALVYMSGSLKFLSDNKTVAEALLSHDALSIFTQFMNNTIEATVLHGDTKRQKYASDFLVQITAAFRNVMDVDKKASRSLSSTSTLLRMLEVFGSDGNLTWNISRIFSKMTMYASATPTFLAEPDWSRVIMTSLLRHSKRAEVVVRLCFTVGNLSARSEHAREDLFFRSFDEDDENHDCLSVMLDVIEDHIDDVTNDDVAESRDKSHATDVVVKIIRVIANLSLAENVGPLVAADERCLQMLLHILETTSVENSEELVVNSLATLSNLSFYDHKLVRGVSGAGSAVTNNRLQIAVCLSKLMMLDNMACVAEVCRVFGNLTRYKDVRDLLHQHKVDLMMVALLDSSDRQVAYYACGILVNVSTDVEKRNPIVQEGALLKLIDVLKDFAPTEWRIGGVVCQLIWNLISGGRQLVDECRAVVDILKEFLDYDSVCARCDVTSRDQDSRDYLLASWSEDFVEFAKPLLATMTSQKESNLVPLDRPIDSDHSSVEGT